MMTLVELKKSIHERIDNLNDSDFLEMLNDMISQKDEVFIIPEHMKKGIRQGRTDLQTGDFISLGEFEKKYEEWLKK